MAADSEETRHPRSAFLCAFDWFPPCLGLEQPAETDRTSDDTDGHCSCSHWSHRSGYGRASFHDARLMPCGVDGIEQCSRSSCGLSSHVKQPGRLSSRSKSRCSSPCWCSAQPRQKPSVMSARPRNCAHSCSALAARSVLLGRSCGRGMPAATIQSLALLLGSQPSWTCRASATARARRGGCLASRCPTGACNCIWRLGGGGQGVGIPTPQQLAGEPLNTWAEVLSAVETNFPSATQKANNAEVSKALGSSNTETGKLLGKLVDYVKGPLKPILQALMDTSSRRNDPQAERRYRPGIHLYVINYAGRGSTSAPRPTMRGRIARNNGPWQARGKRARVVQHNREAGCQHRSLVGWLVNRENFYFSLRSRASRKGGR
jgi:hypothetical protein